MTVDDIYNILLVISDQLHNGLVGGLFATLLIYSGMFISKRGHTF